MKKKVLAIAVLVAAAAAAAIYYGARNAGRKSGIIRVSGNIEVTTVELSFKIPGRVAARLVDEGETVKAGQLVAKLDDQDLVQEVAGKEAEVQAARAALAELETGYRKEDIAQAAAALQRVKADADRLKADFVRQQALFKKEVISRRDFDAAKAANEGAQASVRESRERLALLRRGPRKETIDQARARFRDAEAMLGLARTRLGYATLVSSVGGLVLSKNIEPGEQVAAGTPVVTVGVLDSVWVRAYIDESDLGKVKVGQKAFVTTDSYPGKKYRGYVSFISSEAEFTPKNVQTVKERVKLVYRVKIVIPNPEMELKPGMPADGEIQVKQTED
ncbi:MAG TPA: efflux RND transporter periplasmic adaptor subunit [Geobacteraceae bacterium]|nr:efflux RND transporter periplasmic adaptor subunit [Geobacteraceae bacterium]